MKLIALFLITLITSFNVLYSKESNHLCHLRGYEIIFPYEQAISEIKEYFKNKSERRDELSRFKKNFEENFYGIPLYKEAGCSNARLSEYLTCLINTDGKDCKIYYTQMRIVD